MNDDKKTREQLIDELDKMRIRVEELEKQSNLKIKTENNYMPEEYEWASLAFEAINDGIWGWNISTGEAYFSNQYYSIMGYEPGEFPASYDNWKKLVHPDDIANAEKEIQNAVNKQIPYSIEFRMKAKNGEWMWILSRGRVIRRDDKGNLVRMAGSHADISERKKMEESLRLTRAVFERAPIGIWRMGRDGEILNVNEEGVKSLGYSKDELLNMLVFDFAPGFTVENWKKGTIEIAEKGVRTVEVKHKKKDGTIFDVQVIEKLMKFEGAKHHIAFVKDITEQKKVEETLRLARDIIDKANVGIYLITPCGEIKWVNQKAADILGYAKDELEKMTIKDIDIKLEHESWEPVWERLNIFEIDKFEREHKKKDGKEIPVEIYSNYIEFEGDKYAVAFVQDITERKRKDELIREKDKLLYDIGRLVKVGAWKFDIKTGKATSTDEVARIFDMESIDNVEVGYALKYYQGENRVKIEKAFNDAIENGTPYDLDLEIVSEKGIHKWTRNFCNPVIKNRKVIQLMGSIQDITEIKSSEILLKKSETRYRSLIELSPLGIGIVNSKGIIVDANDSLATMLGYELYELKGLSFREITHHDDLEREDLLLKSLEDLNKTSFSLEKRYRHKKGNYFWVNITVGKTYDIYGTGVFYFGLVEEISSRKKLEEEREKLINDLKKALDEIKQLQGFIPICANCKKIRDDTGYWQQVEKYIADRTDAQFSHSLCPECVKKLYPNIHQKLSENN